MYNNKKNSIFKRIFQTDRQLPYMNSETLMHQRSPPSLVVFSLGEKPLFNEKHLQHLVPSLVRKTTVSSQRYETLRNGYSLIIERLLLGAKNIHQMNDKTSQCRQSPRISRLLEISSAVLRGYLIQFLHCF
jgi:hypothetical protein